MPIASFRLAPTPAGSIRRLRLHPRRKGAPPLGRAFWRVGPALLLPLLAACQLGAPPPNSVSAEERRAAFPTRDLPLHGPACVRWSERSVPFIEASDARDVPLILGLLHGHLRRTQIELFRRLARGEVSRSAGPFGHQVDELVRTLDLDRAVPEIERLLPPETRDWIERYVAGLNLQAERAPEAPCDARLLALDRPEPWTVRDVLTFARLASIDVSLLRTLALVALAEEPGFDSYLASVQEYDARGTPSFGPGVPVPLHLLPALTKSGSNSMVVAPSRSRSGGALMANDPHLGLLLPNLWCLVGYRTPRRSVVGFTLPGIPAVVLGRNDRIAWGGTNMIAFSSALYDARALPTEQVRTRKERLPTRWWFDGEAEVEETPYGPLLSAASLLEDLDLPPLALRWRGHLPSDEITAFLRASHAGDWGEFRAAWGSYAVTGQNMLYADVEGNIAQVMALEQIPAAARGGRALVLDPGVEPPFGPGTPPTSLPAVLNPERGYIVSANNHPVLTDPPVARGGNSNDRVARMTSLIERRTPLGIADLGEIQRDVVLPAARETARALVFRSRGTPHRKLLELLRGWDGSYDASSRAAPAYRRWIFELFEGPYRKRLGRKIAEEWRDSAAVHVRVLDDLNRGWLREDEVRAALERAAEEHDLEQTWGELHRVVVQHPLGLAPLIGEAWRYAEFAGSGTLGTVLKTAGPFTPRRHRVRFGAQSRHLSDLADPDASWFVLLGGQDGWVGSEHYGDQIPLWVRGEYVQVPMTPEKVRELHPHVTRLEARRRE